MRDVIVYEYDRTALCVYVLWQYVETQCTAFRLIENFTDIQLL